MVHEIIHKLMFLRTLDIYIPLIMVSENDDIERKRKWAIPTFLGRFSLTYNDSEIKHIIDCYKKNSKNVCFVYRGKWIHGKEFARLLQCEFKQAYYIEELKSFDFPAFTLIKQSGEEKNIETETISDSESLIKFVEKYQTELNDNNDFLQKLIPVVEFSNNEFKEPSAKERKINKKRNLLEKTLNEKYILYIKEGSNFNGYIKCANKNRLYFSQDKYDTLTFDSPDEAKKWETDNALWDTYGIKCEPRKIKNELLS